MFRALRSRPHVITTDQIIIILAGALAGGLVSGLTGFGTALTAVGLWLFAIPHRSQRRSQSSVPWSRRFRPCP